MGNQCNIWADKWCSQTDILERFFGLHYEKMDLAGGDAKHEGRGDQLEDIVILTATENVGFK